MSSDETPQLVVLEFDRYCISEDDMHKVISEFYKEFSQYGIAGFTLAAWDHKGHRRGEIFASDNTVLTLGDIPGFAEGILIDHVFDNLQEELAE